MNKEENTNLCIEVKTDMLSKQFRDSLLQTIKEHAGNTELFLYLTNPETHFRIGFYSKKYRVSVTPGLIDALTKMGITITHNDNSL